MAPKSRHESWRITAPGLEPVRGRSSVPETKFSLNVTFIIH